MLQTFEVTGYICYRPQLLSHNSSEDVQLPVRVENRRSSRGLSLPFRGMEDGIEKTSDSKNFPLLKSFYVLEWVFDFLQKFIRLLLTIWKL